MVSSNTPPSKTSETPGVAEAGESISSTGEIRQHKDVASAASGSSGRVKGFVVFISHFLLAAILLVGGVFLIQIRAQAEPVSSPDSPVSVHVLTIQQQTSYTFMERFTGRIEAAQTTDSAFEAGGTLKKVFVSEGEQVRVGDVLATLDGRTIEAQQVQLQASRRQLVTAVEGAELELQRERELEARFLTTERAVDNARLALEQRTAAVEELDATMLALDIAADKLSIRAPFDGIVGTRHLDEGAIAGSGSPVVTLFETANPVVIFSLPPDRIRLLKSGQHYPVFVGNRHFRATYQRARPDLNSQTRTIDARFVIGMPDDDALPLFGQLAKIDLVREVGAAGYWIPVSALTEGERGLWSVLVVADVQASDEALSGSAVNGSVEGVPSEARVAPDVTAEGEKRIQQVHVEVLHSDATLAFVTADMPASANIVDQGTHRVVPGQRVVITTRDR